jgi:uncharacterized membrane protein
MNPSSFIFRKLLYPSMIIVLAAWIFILLPSWLMSRGSYTAGILLHYAFSPICHQIPDRCFRWLGYPLPLCARCLGLFSGVTLGWFSLNLVRILPPLPNRFFLCLSLFLLAGDVSAPFHNFYLQNGMTRLLTGMFCGLCFSPYLLWTVEELSMRWSRFYSGVLSL